MGHPGGLLEGGLDTLHESWKSRQGPPEAPWARGQHPVQTPITGSVTEEGGCGPGRRAWVSGDGTHPAPPLTGCVPSGKSPHFLKPHIPHLENRVDQGTCFFRLYMWMADLTQPGPWKPSVNSKSPGELPSISQAKTWQRRQPVESGLASGQQPACFLGPRTTEGVCLPAPGWSPRSGVGCGWGGFLSAPEGRHCFAHCPLPSPLSPVTCAASCSQGWPGRSGRDIPHIAVPGERLG